MSSTYGIIGSSGEVELYADPYGNVTPQDAQEAAEAEEQILLRKNMIEQSFLEMAFLLHDFDEHKHYLGRGYESLKDWSESFEVNIGWRVALDLLRITREAVPILREKGGSLDSAITALSQAKISKTRAMLPLIAKGMDDEFCDLMSRAPNMTLRDVNREVRQLTKGDEDGDEMPAVFKARVRRGEKTSRYHVMVMDGKIVEDVGDLIIPNRYTNRFDERFGRFLEYELEGSS